MLKLMDKENINICMLKSFCYLDQRISTKILDCASTLTFARYPGDSLDLS